MFSNGGFRLSLEGSMVRFRKRPPTKPLSSEEERIESEKKMFMGQGIDVLRKMRGRIFATMESQEQQALLKESYDLADACADYLLMDSLGMLTEAKDHPYVQRVQEAQKALGDTPWDTKRSIVPSRVIQNLREATQDILIRVEEIVQSLERPTRRLNKTEMLAVLIEFLDGTNGLSSEPREHFFDPQVKAGGILSGGMVYLLIAKKIVERYGEEGLAIHPFVIAVDQENKKFVCETSDTDKDALRVYVLDDMVDTGGTILKAWRSVGEHFPNAYIYSEKGTEHPGEWQMQAQQKIKEELSEYFHDFCEAQEEGRLEEAQRILDQAEAFARRHNVELSRGWSVRKKRLDALLGKQES